MTRCKEFYEKVERDGDFCGMNEDTLREVLAFIDFVEQYPDLSGISEKAAKPLIREKDSGIKAKAIEAVGNNISHGNVPTAKQVKTILENKRAGVEAGGRIQRGQDLRPNQPTLSMKDFLSPENDKVEDIEDPEIDVEQEYYIGDAPVTPDEQENLDGGEVQKPPGAFGNSKEQKTDIAVPPDISDISVEMEKERVAQAIKDLQKEKEDERERNEITEKNENTKTRDVLLSVLKDAMKSALHKGMTRKEVFEALHIAIDSVFEPIESNEERKKHGSELTSVGVYK